jgi:hypothetical protein
MALEQARLNATAMSRSSTAMLFSRDTSVKPRVSDERKIRSDPSRATIIEIACGRQGTLGGGSREAQGVRRQIQAKATGNAPIPENSITSRERLFAQEFF